MADYKINIEKWKEFIDDEHLYSVDAGARSLSDSPACYITASPKTCITTKTIEYECGCPVILGAGHEKDAPHACMEHGFGIKRITTVDEFMSMDSLEVR